MIYNHDFVLRYAYNATVKTRRSIAFKEKGSGDTLYFNAFTEGLFHWGNERLLPELFKEETTQAS